MIIVLTTYPTKENAQEMAEKLVNLNLAACVSIIKNEESIYRWKGKIERNSEFTLLIKSSAKAYSKLELMIKQNHPYEVPEIIYLEVKGGSQDYLDWVEGNSNGISRLLSVPLQRRETNRVEEPSRELSSAKKPRTLSI